jgi:hypothetical protein
MHNAIVRARVPFIVALIAVVISYNVSLAATPTVRSASVRGLTAGAKTTIVMEGGNLGPNPKLLLSVPIAAQEAKLSAKRDQVTFDVTLAADTPAGIYQLWVATDAGISAPMEVAIDRLPELPMSDKIEKLPAALNGLIASRDVLRTSFEGKAGQPIVIDVEARRLGSAFNPVVRLYDPRGVQLAWAQGQDSIFGDARIVTQLTHDGHYTIELHDALFNARGAYRLKVGALEYADLAFPLAGKTNQAVPVGFVDSNFPMGTAVVAQSAHEGTIPVPWPASPNVTGARPRMVVSDMDEFIEQSAEGAPQQLTVPAGVSGRIAQPGEGDRYEFVVAPKAKLRFEVMANRLGSPLDGVLTVRKPDGAVLGTNDDQPMTSDPGVRVDIPADVKSVTVTVVDRAGRGGSNFVYRLSAANVSQADLDLDIQAVTVPVPSRGVMVARVHATRRANDNPIQLSLDPMPPGVTLTGAEIPAGATDTLLTFTTGEHAPEAVLTRLVGRVATLKSEIRRTAQTPTRAVASIQPWLRNELPMAFTEASPLEIAFEPASGDAALPLGAVLPLKVKLTRTDAAKGSVRISLLTSQVMPTKKVPKVDARKRPAGEEVVDDIDRALRLKFADDAKELIVAADSNEATAEVIVPGDLVDIPYDVTFKAELLAADGKRVMAEAYAPASRLRTTYPFTIELAGPAAIEAKAGMGDTGSLQGKIVRKAGFDGPVTVTLRGLPDELLSPTVAVAAKKDTFALPVAFAYHTAAGELKGAKLVAEAKGAFGPIESNALPVSLMVVKGEAPQGAFRIFDDEPAFLALLSEGDGTAKLDAKDRFSGKAALSVTPDKQRTRLPGLGMKIVENPKPGEYRYLRFAWKAHGGHNMMLRLFPNKSEMGADGKRTLAYESGDASNRLRLVAERIDEKVPTEWTVVTRDLFADFGAFTLEGLQFSPCRAVGYPDEKGEYGLYDQIYLGRTLSDFESLESKPTSTAKAR